MTMPHPVQQFFSIGEVCSLTELKPHVLRYWESQFRFLSPAKNRSGNRVYKAREVELIMLVKHLLYTEKFTIEGARIRLDQYRKSGDLKMTGKQAMRYETVGDVRRGARRRARGARREGANDAATGGGNCGTGGRAEERASPDPAPA